jgi:lysozyme family protein
MSDAAFARVIPITLQWEGGYVDDPDDPGGVTNFGLSQRSYPELDIAALTIAEAEAIYRRDWWNQYGLGTMPDPVGAKTFDTIVNMGASGGFRVLQQALRSIGQDVDIDGILGPQTRGAVAAADPARLLPAQCLVQAAHYEAIVAQHHALQKYLRGWIRRARSVPIPA